MVAACKEIWTVAAGELRRMKREEAAKQTKLKKDRRKDSKEHRILPAEVTERIRKEVTLYSGWAWWYPEVKRTGPESDLLEWGRKKAVDLARKQAQLRGQLLQASRI